MKIPLLNFSKLILAFGVVLISFIQLNAQCSVSTDLVRLAAGQYQNTTIPNIPANWEQTTTINFGDGSNGNTYSGSANSYGSMHSYYGNGTYIITTTMYTYNLLDSTQVCSSSDIDTVVVTDLSCYVSTNIIDVIPDSTGTQYHFNGNYQSGDPYVQTTWMVRDSFGNILSSYSALGNTSFDFNFPGNGNYTVTFTGYAYDSLTSTTCMDSSNIGVNFSSPLPQPCNASFYMWEDSLVVGQWYAINNSLGNGTLSYVWDFGDGTSASNLAYPSHTYSTPGNYVICLTIADSTGCSSSTCDSSAAFRISQQQSVNGIIGSLIVTAPVGIHEIKKSLDGIKLFPNPMLEGTTITFEALQSSKCKIEIVNMLGQLISKTQYEIKNGSNEIKLNTGSLLEGVYSINVFSNNQYIVSIKAIK